MTVPPKLHFRTANTPGKILDERNRIRPSLVNRMPTGAYRLQTALGSGAPGSGGTSDPIDPGSPGLPYVQWLGQKLTLTHNNANTGIFVIGDSTLVIGATFFWEATRGTTIRGQGMGSAGFLGASCQNSWLVNWQIGGSLGITGTSVAAILDSGVLKVTIPVDNSSTDDIDFRVKYSVWEV